MARKSIKLAPEVAAQAQAFAAALGVASTASDGRVPCAFGACDRTFLPNGSGPFEHGSCPAGRVVMRKARAEKLDSDAVLALGPSLVEAWRKGQPS